MGKRKKNKKKIEMAIRIEKKLQELEYLYYCSCKLVGAYEKMLKAEIELEKIKFFEAMLSEDTTKREPYINVLNAYFEESNSSIFKENMQEGIEELRKFSLNEESTTFMDIKPTKKTFNVKVDNDYYWNIRPYNYEKAVYQIDAISKYDAGSEAWEKYKKEYNISEEGKRQMYISIRVNGEEIYNF